MKYRLVIWDIDGTLLNTLEGLIASYQYTLRLMSLPEKTDEEVKRFIGPSPATIFREKFGLCPEESQRGSDIFRARYKEHDLYKAYPYEGIFDVLQTLADRGVLQAIATNKRQDYAVDIIRHFGMDAFCSPILGTNNESSLTKTQMIENCVYFWKISDRRQVVMIGDTAGDREAAAKAGVDFMGVNYGFGLNKESDCANTPYDILAMLQKN